jgi:hypothetical protein
MTSPTGVTKFAGYILRLQAMLKSHVQRSLIQLICSPYNGDS